MKHNYSDRGMMAAIDDQAAAWDARLRAADCTEEERVRFRSWCEQQSEHQQRFDTLQLTLSALRDAADLPEIQSMREAALVESKKTGLRAPALRWLTGIAASVGVAVFGFSLIPIDSEVLIVADRSDPHVYVTAVGERSTANLADGTVATLNTNTRIRVEYSDTARIVILDQGQALFEVAKNPDRPFTVVAGDQRITAIGTIFDVRYQQDEVKVTLVEGVIEVVTEQVPGTNLTGPAAATAPVRLTAGQQLLTTAIASPSLPTVQAADAELETIWRQGRVFFEDVPLPEAVAEMNRYSVTQIIVADDPALVSHKVNGMFRTGQQVNFVSALEDYFPVEIEQAGTNRLLLKSR